MGDVTVVGERKGNAMPEQQTLEVQQGIWISERWIRRAGLGVRLRVLVLPGEIRILGMPVEAERRAASERGWDVFRSLGRDAQPGQLPNAAMEHDRYLYGKTDIDSHRVHR